MENTEIKKTYRFYRNLNAKERDLLFAFYEKWNGNCLAMVRDSKCQFHSQAQILYYKKLYNFEEQLVVIRRREAEKIIGSLKESKNEAIKRAMEMLKPHQSVLKHPLTKEVLLDEDEQPIFIEIQPSPKEVKMAWEIIKTELGEPTTISKGDITSGGKPIQSNVITFKDFDGNGANSEQKI